MSRAAGVTLLEDWLDGAAAACLAGAVAFALAQTAPWLGLGSVAAACGVWAGCWIALQWVKSGSSFMLPPFRVLEINADHAQSDVDELLLSRDQIVGPSPQQCDEPTELLLDDVLAQIDPNSRVVSLFAAASLPTAGELKSRIDRHLHCRPATPQPVADASDALSEALAELRRSLR